MVPRIPGRTTAVLVDEVDANHRNGTFAIPSGGIILLMDEHDASAGVMAMTAAGATFTRDTTGTPAAGQFYYDPELRRVICNATDAGKTVNSLQYYSLGGVVRAATLNDILAAVQSMATNKSDVLRVASSLSLTAANAPDYDLAIVNDGTNPPTFYVSDRVDTWNQTAGSSAPAAGTLGFTAQPALVASSVTGGGWIVQFAYQNDGSANPVTIEQQLVSGGAWTTVTPVAAGAAWRVTVAGQAPGSYAHKIRLSQGASTVTSTTAVVVNLSVPAATVNVSNVAMLAGQGSMNVAGVVSGRATQGTVTKLRFVCMLAADADEAAAVTAGRYIDLVSPTLDVNGNYSASLSPLSMAYSAAYTVKVQVTQLSGDGITSQAGNWSAGAAISTPAVPVVTGFAVTPGNAQNTLSWSALGTGETVNIYRSLTAGVKGSLLYSGLTGTSKVDPSLTNGTTYYYTATRVVGSTESADSAQVSEMPSANLTAGTVVSLTGGNMTALIGSENVSYPAYITQTAASTFRLNSNVKNGTTEYMELTNLSSGLVSGAYLVDIDISAFSSTDLRDCYAISIRDNTVAPTNGDTYNQNSGARKIMLLIRKNGSNYEASIGKINATGTLKQWAPGTSTWVNWGAYPTVITLPTRFKVAKDVSNNYTVTIGSVVATITSDLRNQSSSDYIIVGDPIYDTNDTSKNYGNSDMTIDVYQVK